MKIYTFEMFYMPIEWQIFFQGVNKNVKSNASASSAEEDSEASMTARTRRRRMAENESLELEEEETPYEPSEDDVDASEKVGWLMSYCMDSLAIRTQGNILCIHRKALYVKSPIV